MVKVDVLPIAKSSLNQLWPMLGSLFKINYVFVVTTHSQDRKPTDIDRIIFRRFYKRNKLINWEWVKQLWWYAIKA